MTLEDGDGDAVHVSVDFTKPQRDKPKVHASTDHPLCDSCQKLGLDFFDPGCPGCYDILGNPSTTIAELFAILRQWTPQTQQNLELIVREILKRGAHPNDRDIVTDMTLLHYAAKAGANGVGDVEQACSVVNMLITRGADVYIRSRWTSMTALHYAAFFDVAAIVRILLKATKGYDIESPCTEFDHGTPLHIAASSLAHDTCKCLLQNGASTQAKDDLGRRPIECVPDPSSFEAGSDMGKLVGKIRKMLSEAETENQSELGPTYDHVGGKVTLQSLGLKLGGKVLVGGVKSGTLRFVGPTEFAPGMWAGIELDDPEGKNDGSVGGISYFKCSSKHGIFAPLSKVAKPGTQTPRSSREGSTPGRATANTNYGKLDVSHVKSKIDSGLRTRTPTSGRTGTPATTVSGELEIGDRVMVAGQRKGTIKFVGETKFAPGIWYGIELDKSVGKNDGSVNGERYFSCKHKHGVFAPLSRVHRLPLGNLGMSLESLNSQDLGASYTGPSSSRRLSAGSRSASQDSLHSNPPTNRAPRSGGSSLKRSVSSSGGSRKQDFKLEVGTSVFCNNELGVVRYIGQTDFAPGIWLGVELRTPKGKNDGCVAGKRYFNCKAGHGLIVRPSRVTVRGINGARLLGDMHSADFK